MTRPRALDRPADGAGEIAEITVAFGDMTKFLVRKVKPMTMIRLDEKYAESGQVAFLAFARVDSNLLDAGTHPINVLQQHS